MAYDGASTNEGSAVSATDRAFERIRRQILTCILPPGSLVNEGPVAEALGMSKTPVREALAKLVHEGWLTVEARHGYRVKPITLADVHEIFSMRRWLEPAAAGLVAQRADPEQLRELVELAHDHQPSRRNDLSQGEYSERSMAFHYALAKASGNGRLQSALNRLFDETVRLRYAGLELTSLIEAQADDHSRLVEALLQGNQPMAEELAAKQVESSRQYVMEALLERMSRKGGDALLTINADPTRA